MAVYVVCRGCGARLYLPFRRRAHMAPDLIAFRLRCPRCGHEDAYSLADVAEEPEVGEPERRGEPLGIIGLASLLIIGPALSSIFLGAAADALKRLIGSRGAQRPVE